MKIAKRSGNIVMYDDEKVIKKKNDAIFLYDSWGRTIDSM